MAKKLVVDFEYKNIVSAIVAAPYNEGKEILESKGYREITLEENAFIRSVSNPKKRKESVWVEGNRVKENCLYIPRKGIYLSKYCFPKDFPDKITMCHKDHEEFYLDEENGFNKDKIQEILNYSIRLVKDNKRDKLEVSIGDIGSDKRTQFAFGKSAGDYCSVLEKELEKDDVDNIVFWFDRINDRPFVRKVFFASRANGSRFACSYKGLHQPYFLRGIKTN